MAKKKKAPFPIYSVSEFQRPANCDEGENCNPAENPAHHVLIDLTPEARAVVQDLIDNLAEVHAHEIEKSHYGDPGGARACSYCQSMKAGRQLLAHAEEK